MHCQEIRELLSPYIDRMLEPEQQSQVEQHLEGCEQCQQELAELQFVLGLMQESAESLAPAGFSSKVMERLNAPDRELPKWRYTFSKLVPAGWFGQRPDHSKGTTSQGQPWGRIITVAAMLIIAVAVSTDLNKVTDFSIGALNQTKSSQEEANQQTAQDTTQEATQDTTVADQGFNSTGAAPETAKRMAPSASFYMAPQAELSKSKQGNHASKTRAFADSNTTVQSTAERNSTVQSTAERKIIKNGRVQLEVTNIDKTNAQIMERVKSYQGYIESSSLNNSPQNSPSEEQYRSGNLVIRIPVNQYENFFAQIKTMGNVVFQEIRGQDVSSEFYDTQARIRNWKQQEVRLLEILKQAKNVEEILRVEGELQRVRQEVEVMEGRIRSLGNLSEMATLEVTLTQVKANNVISLPEKNVFQKAGEAFIRSVNELLDFAGNMVIVLGGLAPVLLILALVVGGAILYRRWKAKQTK